jgi:signal transduction histidine kinase
MNILIVDDVPVNLKLLRATLEAAGHVVTEAKNGVVALELLHNGSHDAVIADVFMPRMDGFRLCQQIRMLPRPLGDLPFVLYTATYDSPSDRALAKSIGVDCFLIRPAPAAAILQAVSDAVQRSANRAGHPAVGVDERYVLEHYNAALVQKLENRTLELHESVLNLQAAHGHIADLNRNLEARVMERTAALSHANKELEAFSYSVSHDLRGPLTCIQGYAQFIWDRNSCALDADARESLQHILKATGRMSNLIDSLIELSRGEVVQLEYAVVDIEELVDDILATLEPEIRGRPIQWIRSTLPTLRADATLIRQVFVNLIANALKFTRTRNPAVIEVGTREGRAGEVAFFVRDNGVGFDMEMASKLFGPFSRMHSAREFEGSGIGLANVRRIINRHGGAVWVHAAVGSGATFYFSLPTSDRIERSQPLTIESS